MSSEAVHGEEETLHQTEMACRLNVMGDDMQELSLCGHALGPP